MRSPRAKINFREYKLSRMGTLFVFFINISRVTSKVRFRRYITAQVALNKRFRRYKLSPTPKKSRNRESLYPRKFIPLVRFLSTLIVINWTLFMIHKFHPKIKQPRVSSHQFMKFMTCYYECAHENC